MRTQTNWTGITFGALLGVLAAYQQFKLPPALPLLLAQFGYDRILAGGFMSVYAFVGLVLSVQLGRAMQRRGMATFLYLAFALMVAGNLLTLFVPHSGAVVLLARALEGIAFAVLAISGPVLANLSASAGHLAFTFAITASWIPVGQIIATVIAQPALERGLWQPLWWVAIVVSLVMAVLTCGLQRTGRIRLTDVPAASDAGDLPAPRAKRRNLLLAAGVFTLWSTQYFAYMTWLPAYLVDVHGMRPEQAVIAYLIPVATLLAFIFVTAGILRAGFSLGWLLSGSLIIQGIVWLFLSEVDGGLSGVISLIAWGVGAGVTPVCLFGLPTTIMGAGRAGPRAFGILMTGRNLGVFMGPILLASALDLTGSWDIAGPIFGTITLAAAIAAFYLARQLHASERIG